MKVLYLSKIEGIQGPYDDVFMTSKRNISKPKYLYNKNEIILI